MDFRNLLETTWSLSMKNMVPLLMITLMLMGMSLFSGGILAPVALAGYTHSILRMVRDGREPMATDLFSQMRLFFPLLLFGVLAFFCVFIGYLLLVVPGIAVSIALLFCCTYMLPLMTDTGMGLVEALKESFAMACGGKIAEHAVVVTIYGVVTMIGGSFLLGILVTMPLATVFLMLAYEERRGFFY